jgi:hypothetical protein
VVNQVVKTLADMPKQEERKLNLRLTSFEAKEGETEKEFMQEVTIVVITKVVSIEEPSGP